MVAALLIAMMPAQFCRDLPQGDRILCNQLHQVNDKLDALSSERVGALRRQDDLEHRIKSLEKDNSENVSEIRELRKWRDESKGERNLVIVVSGILTGIVMAGANQFTAARRRRNGKSQP